MLILTNKSDSVITCMTTGITLVPGQSVELTTSEQLETAARSPQLLSYIANDIILVNDGIKDLTMDEAVRALAGQAIITGPRDKTGKLRVHQTSRALGTTTCFVGCGDDPSDITKVGGGTECIFRHKVGDTMSTSYYIDLNIIENETYVHEAYITWENCNYDIVTADIVPYVTSVEPAENTNYSLYGGYLIIPAMGNGTINVTSDITDLRGGLIQMPLNDLGQRPTAYWNANYNNITKKYENITYAMGDGEFNMFAAEVPIFRIFNRVPLLSTGFIEFRTSDTSQVGQGMRLKVTCETAGDDHDWGIAFTLVLHRSRSI